MPPSTPTWIRQPRPAGVIRETMAVYIDATLQKRWQAVEDRGRQISPSKVFQEALRAALDALEADLDAGDSWLPQEGAAKRRRAEN